MIDFNRIVLLLSVVPLVITLPVLAQEPVPVVVVMPESMASVERAELTGSFTARRVSQLSARTAGLVEDITVDAGDRVAAGDLLVQLDTDLAALAVARAEATVQERQASLNEAGRLLEEGRRLVQDRFVPQTEFQAREAGAALAEAALASSQADLATARARLNQHRILAPFDGVISSRSTEVGEWIETGTATVELVAIDELWLDIRAPQQYWNSLIANANAEVFVDALPGTALAASVHARVPVKDPDARTFLVRLRLDEPNTNLTPGMSASAVFEWSTGGQILRVPRDALTRYPDGTTTLWVVNESTSPATVNEIRVEIQSSSGGLSSGYVEIISGLNAVQPVVVRGNEVLSEAQSVRVVQE